MRRWWLVLIAAAVAAALLWTGRTPDPGPAEPPDPYRPRELPPDIRARLVVRDHPWPHANPIADPNRFQGERPDTWAEHLEAAVAAFQRRYPGVDVVVEMAPFAPEPGEAAAEVPPSSTGDSRPDVAAVWWGGPLPPADELVPLNRYLTEAVRQEYHPAAWVLVETHGVYWGWPRWLALHYWIAAQDGPPGGTVTGWTMAQALDAAAAPGLLAPPAGGGLLLELGAGRVFLPDTTGDPDRQGGVAAAAADPGDGGSPGGFEGAATAAELAEALAALRPVILEAHAGGDLGSRLADGRFGLAAGFGPAVGHWAVTPPLSGRSRPDDPPLDLVFPPVVAGAPAAVPVVSPGAWVIPRKEGADEGVRAQLAVDLARHLSALRGEVAVARLLALPAHLAALDRWRSEPPLPPAAAQRVLGDLERAAAEGLRLYGRPDRISDPLDPAAAREWWRRWLDGDLTDEALARLLAGTAGDAPTLAGTRDAEDRDEE